MPPASPANESRRRLLALPAAALPLFGACALSPHSPAFDPLSQDPPPDPAYPADSLDVSFDSHGARLAGRLFLAAGHGPHPAVLISRGMPDLLGSLDVAMALRRAGFHVLSFNNRGCWGSQGSFSLEHAYEDMQAALAFLRRGELAASQRIDLDRLALLGFSWGGPVALKAAAADPRVRGLALIDATDMRSDIAELRRNPQPAIRWLSGLGAVRIDDPAAMIETLIAKEAFWNPLNERAGMAGKEVLVLVASQGTGAEPAQHPSLQQMFSATARVEALSFNTSHGFDDSRVALTRAVLRWAERLRSSTNSGVAPARLDAVLPHS